MSYLGVEPEVYGPGHKKTEQPMFLCLGRLMAYKRVDVLIRLMARVVETVPEASLHIAGCGPMESGLKRLVAQQGLQDHVVFHGYVSLEEKVALLQQAWVLVTASAKEGWGLVVIEANACGTPAIAFDVPGLCEAIEDGHTGLLVRSEAEFLQAMLRLVKDQQLRLALTRSALEHARHFDWDVTALQTLRVLASQAEGRKGYQPRLAQTPAGAAPVEPVVPQRRWRREG